MINVQAVADYLASTSGSGGEDAALIASLLSIANTLATQQQQTGGALANAAQLPATTAPGTVPGLGNVETPPEVETLAEGIKMFVQRYPIDSRAYEYLVTSPATVVAHVLRDFRPPREGEPDYSKIITTYVRRIRAAYSGTSDFPLAIGPNLGSTFPAASAPLLGAAPRMAPAFAANKPVIIRPPASIIDPASVDYVEVIQQFVQKYPVDERAYNFLVNASPTVQLRVLQEFRPHRMGDSDYSALLTTFTKKCMDQAKAQEGGSALAALAAPMGGSFPQQPLGGGGCVRVGRTVQLPPGGMPKDLATAMITPGLDEFLAKYPLDERAYDYFAVSSSEVQLKVLQEFQPIREGEASYSGLFTAFVKKCRTVVGNNGGAVDAATAPGGIMGDEFQIQAGELDDPTGILAATGGLAEGVNMSTSSLKRTLAALRTGAHDASGAPLDLEAFRLRFPMDERAFDFLSTAPREVQERVLETFVPQRLDDSDFSAAITAYVRSLRNQVAEASVMGGVTDEAVIRFFERYPCDARATDYFNMCTPDVQAQVLRDFRPRSEGDADYSAAITAYVKCCRVSQKQLGSWRPPTGGWGPPKRPRLV